MYLFLRTKTKNQKLNLNLFEHKLQNYESIDSTLIQAVKNNSGYGKIIQLLGNGANVSAKDCDGITALMHAAKLGDWKAIEYLMQCGANPEEKDEKGWTALNYAQKYKQYDILKYFIRNDYVEGINFTQLFHDAVRTNDWVWAKISLDNGVSRENVDSTLRFASEQGNVRVMFSLLEIIIFFLVLAK